VFTVHGFAAPFHSWAKRMSYLWLERLLQSVTHTTVCVARAEADLFGSFHLAPPDRIRIVHCGIDVDHFASPPTDAARLRDELRLGAGPVILTACRLHVPRDFESLLAAFHTVQGEMPGARLVIAGDGPQRDRIRKRCDALCLTESVRLIGLRNDVAALLTLAQVSVLTSTGWEGFPVSTLEAQAAGVPVVVTDAGGSREAVLDGRTGFVIPKKDPNALAAVLMRLLRDGDLRRRLGAEGRKRAQAEFSRARMIRRIREIYEELS
jgi:glycosyltransferase involved in cell wall biosynthesis